MSASGVRSGAMVRSRAYAAGIYHCNACTLPIAAVQASETPGMLGGTWYRTSSDPPQRVSSNGSDDPGIAGPSATTGCRTQRLSKSEWQQRFALPRSVNLPSTAVTKPRSSRRTIPCCTFAPYQPVASSYTVAYCSFKVQASTLPRTYKLRLQHQRRQFKPTDHGSY